MRTRVPPIPAGTDLAGRASQTPPDRRDNLASPSLVFEMPLHDAPAHRRNNLLLLGVSERAVIDIMGWSSAKMTWSTSTSPTASAPTSPAGWSGYLWNSPRQACPAPAGRSATRTDADRSQPSESNSGTGAKTRRLRLNVRTPFLRPERRAFPLFQMAEDTRFELVSRPLSTSGSSQASCALAD